MKKRIAATLLAAIILVGIMPSTVAQAATINRLTGVDKKVCEVLQERIKDVAMGSSASTVFTFEISLEEAGLGGRYTATDLGVETILVDRQLAPAAEAAVEQLLKIDLTAIVNELELACPYELYWYDKTQYTSYERIACKITVGFDQTIGGYYIQFGTCEYEFCFPVAQEYAAGEYLVRTADAAAAWDYTAAVDEIIARYAEKSDYEKLTGYRREICNLVAYNEEASKGAVPYGNPWQPVWVFDGIDGTDVVCEGYAKAFQYLCDHTVFDSKAIRCYTVWGVMWGGTGAGRHMWNIVAMDDGANYLVDVTNCDADAIGAEDLLFLKGYDSGSADTSYTYRCGSDTITYVYGEDMWKVYETQELTLSEEDYKVPGPAEFVAVNMTLDEGIGLNFFLDMHDTPVESSYMEFTWGENKYSTDSAPLLVTDGVYTGKYRYTCHISAKEIQDVVYATLRDVTGQPIAEFSYSGGSYLAMVKATGTATVSAMADAAAVYCLAAKAYFMGEAPRSVPEPMEPIPTYFSENSQTADGEISYYGHSLVMRDQMKMRLYFAAPSAPTVTVDGEAFTAVAHMAGGEPDGYYTVDIPVLPGQIGSGFAISVPGTAIDFTIGVGDYLVKVLQREGSNIALKELCRAVYQYGQAAREYMAN